MTYKQLGQFRVSPLALGCMGMSFGYGEMHEKKEMIKFIHKAFELGINFFDTAEGYGAYNEELLGEAVKPFKDKVVVASKFGIYQGKGGSWDLNLDSSPKRIRQALEGSLKRLKVECLDLYYQHRVDPQVPIEEVANTMQELIKEGKIKAWGMSEAGLPSLEKAQAICPLTALQSEYSLWCRAPEKEILGFCETNNITFVGFSPLGKGFFGGKIAKNATFDKEDFRSVVPKFSPENLTKNYALVEVLQDTAKAKNATPAQIALSWILHMQRAVIPLFDTTKEERLLENIGALGVSWQTGELETFKQELEKIAIVGERYPTNLNDKVGK
ncbi:Aldo/keto reductase [Helicobacter sp. NHP19-003]|uniref:Aldo/keto reductase n=1 Tax=Helicobacter gastrocanis TaxID=2849641 RepID=A0ABM7SAX8_9HELI|nr:aldo/keto reductase [Helicobacter sp. NHP19-003]BCZ17763.1 Aldo/keto reductase [Helicobacter sp. NHP19-003]